MNQRARTAATIFLAFVITEISGLIIAKLAASSAVPLMSLGLAVSIATAICFGVATRAVPAALGVLTILNLRPTASRAFAFWCVAAFVFLDSAAAWLFAGWHPSIVGGLIFALAGAGICAGKLNRASPVEAPLPSPDR